MEFFTELIRFIRSRKKYWLIPLIFILIFLGIVVAISGTSALAPFIYSLF